MATIGGSENKAENSGSSFEETGENSEILTKLSQKQKYLGDESGTAARDPTCMHHDYPTLEAVSSDDKGSIFIGSGATCDMNTVVAKKSVHFSKNPTTPTTICAKTPDMSSNSNFASQETSNSSKETSGNLPKTNMGVVSQKVAEVGENQDQNRRLTIHAVALAVSEA